MKKLIFYTKPGCHLCEGLEEKLANLSHLPIDLEMRDITQNPAWFAEYQYEIPVLCRLIKQPETSELEKEQPLPRLSPRAPLKQLEQMLHNYLGPFETK
ncbi:glutaredoxin family protein [Leptothoe kymatousa]|uniref:Glutaredoxin family protein n=1 Tax=Leptothoe kymatousa TAU-MAC 1615 TaxID=2364775 RepID=A0ABS5Y7C5_9CYAN|nr:glutaredoxin family protein [Leptothoe kymatousa]MBT9313715.1 glutaredoxin family protein [Leptothoe kymatousa TAU-MAC 1615]